MRTKITFGLLSFFLVSCSQNEQTTTSKFATDTIVGSKHITEEIAGSSYRERAIAYFVITGKDTSDFTCIFSEQKAGRKVNIDLNIPYLKTTMTHEQRFKELKWILQKASERCSTCPLTFVDMEKTRRSIKIRFIGGSLNF